MLKLTDDLLHQSVTQSNKLNTISIIDADELLKFHQKSFDDASKLVSLYWGHDPKAPVTDTQKIQDHLAGNPITSWWQIIYLIEAAGFAALQLGYSKHKADIAKARNSEPRQWVRDEWSKKKDKAGNKASFSREHANLVHKKFKVKVQSETIYKKWLKGL
jgi:hypothetical protein